VHADNPRTPIPIYPSTVSRLKASQRAKGTSYGHPAGTGEGLDALRACQANHEDGSAARAAWVVLATSSCSWPSHKTCGAWPSAWIRPCWMRPSSAR